MHVEQNEAARAFVQKLVNDRFGGNKLRASKKIGVSYTLLHEFLKGTRGAGMALLAGVSALTGEPIEVITGQASPDTDAIENDPEFPNRSTAAKEARRLGVRELAIRAVLRDGRRSDTDLEVKVWLGEMQRRDEFLSRLDIEPPDEEGPPASSRQGKPRPVAKNSKQAAG
jgi:hypothetical protein